MVKPRLTVTPKKDRCHDGGGGRCSTRPCRVTFGGIRREWNGFDTRAVFLGVMTFLLLQVCVQYQSLHLWEKEVMKRATKQFSSEVGSSSSSSLVASSSVEEFTWSSPEEPVWTATDTSNDRKAISVVEASVALPQWMEDYFVWHRDQRGGLTEENWKDQKLMIVRCLVTDGNQCGAARHRLQSLPLAILLAHQSQRLIFIRWEQPAPLHKFLLPVEEDNALDWRLPDWLHQALGDYDQYPMVRGTSQFGVKRVMDTEHQPVVTTRLYIKDNGKTYYNEQRRNTDEPSFEIVFRTFWFRVFRPSTPVQQLIQQDMQLLDLVDGQYVVAFLPSKSSPFRPMLPKKNMVFSSLDCAKETVPDAFRSDNDNNNRDNSLALVVASPIRSHVDYAMEYTSKNAVALLTPPDLLTLDDSGEHDTSIQRQYQSFVFLYLLAYSQCVIFEHGEADGRWGMVLSHNTLCASSKYAFHLSAQPCHVFTPEEWLPPLVVVLEANKTTTGEGEKEQQQQKQ